MTLDDKLVVLVVQSLDAVLQSEEMQLGMHALEIRALQQEVLMRQSKIEMIKSVRALFEPNSPPVNWLEAVRQHD